MHEIHELDEFHAGVPAHLTLRQRRKLWLEHEFFENCRDFGIIILLIGSIFIFGG